MFDAIGPEFRLLTSLTETCEPPGLSRSPFSRTTAAAVRFDFSQITRRGEIYGHAADFRRRPGLLAHLLSSRFIHGERSRLAFSICKLCAWPLEFILLRSFKGVARLLSDGFICLLAIHGGEVCYIINVQPPVHEIFSLSNAVLYSNKLRNLITIESFFFDKSLFW